MKGNRMAQLIPNLAFAGNAEEVLGHYQRALGGDLELARYAGSPAEAMAPAAWGDKILYGSLHSPFGVVSAMDAPPGHQGTPGDNFSISVQLEDEARAAAIFAALAGGGDVTMPFEPTFYAKKFGMLKDRFGIRWMVHVPVAVLV
jgi:PhnB protein